ncbi:trigger factor [Patescibacteria group bacterium]|nr:trigger factor [Patescibacteria group bacterium]
MNLSIKRLPHSSAEIAITFPHDAVKNELQKAAEELSASLDIPGFRKGKAPYEKVKERVGEFAVYERAAELLIRKQYAEVLQVAAEEEKKSGRPFEPVGAPEIAITKLAPGSDLAYTITLAVMPEILLPDYQSMARCVMQGKKEETVSEKEAEDAVRWLLESRAKYITVSQPAEKGNAIEIDFETFMDGVRLEHGDSKAHPFVLGEGKFIPGFEDELVGMSAGETKEFSLVAPNDYFEKNIAGKKLDFKVSVKLVERREVPEFSDEFARGLGNNFAGAEDAKKSIREGLALEKQKKEQERLRVKMIDEIANAVFIDPPQVLLDAEKKKMIEELRQGIERMGLKWDQYLINIKKTEDELKKGWNKDALRRVTIALVLREIADKESIKPADEEVQEEANKIVLQSGFTDEQIKKIDKVSLKQYAYGIVRNEKVFAFLENIKK